MSNFNIVNEGYMNDYIQKHKTLIPVQEAYFGKTKNLLEAEKAFTEMFIEAFGKPEVPSEYDVLAITKGAVKFAELSRPSSPYMKRVREAFKKEFGFGYFSLSFNNFTYDIYDTPSFDFPSRIKDRLNISNYRQLVRPNGYTLCSNGIIYNLATGNTDMLRISPIKTGSGERYYDAKHRYSCVIVIYSALLLTRGFTPGMLMAVILHEIGHNFVCTPIVNIQRTIPIFQVFKQICVLSNKPDKQLEFIKNNIKKLAMKLGFPIAESIYQELVSEIYGWLMKAKPIAEIVVGVQQLFKIYDMTIDSFFRLAMAVDMARQVTNITPYGYLRSMFESIPDYSNEVFADSFATAYGYGAETVMGEGLFNVHTSEKYYNYALSKDNPFNIFYRIAAVTIEIYLQFLSMDAHPSGQNRQVEQINMLEDEIKSGKLPPELRKAAMEDLKRCKDAYNAYLNADSDDRLISIISTYRIFIDKTLGGRDIRSYINELVNLGHHHA
jgi:hypothetical protein